MDLKTYFVETWGCQMNVLDSQHLEGLLRARGLRPARAADEADVALLNTCAVREKAVQKVLSRLGELRQAQEDGGKPRVVGLCGCVAEQDGPRLLARSKVLSFVIGPGKMSRLGGALEAAVSGERSAVTGFSETRDYDTLMIARPEGRRQFVTAIHGCSQHCTFCVVPYTRGHEVSRPLAEIVAEVHRVVEAGAREVTLLGQTINAYRCPSTGVGFGDLAAEAATTPGLWRLQYLTSHPKFFTENMIDKLAATPRLGTYLHVPFQSGSDSILRRMHRGYSSQEYLALLARLRAAMPGASLSTDVIVGFPGETEGDFEQTLSLVEEARFSQLFGFIFSVRPGTPAARYAHRVPPKEASERLARLFSQQSAIQLELNQKLIGSKTEILVDGPAKRGAGIWHGRGEDNRIVNFPAKPTLAAGDLITVTITGATPHALLGEQTSVRQRPREVIA